MSEQEAEEPEHKSNRCDQIVKAYGVFILLGLLLSFLDNGFFWPITVFDALIHGLLFPAPFLAAFLLAKRRRKLAAGFALASLYLVWICASWFSSPPDPGEPATGESLVVLTWNLGLNTCDAALVAKEILRLEPDVVLFQEARDDRVEEIVKVVGELFPYHEHFPCDLFSKAYLSRIEPLSAQLVTPEDTKNFVELLLPFDGSVLSITSMHTNKAFAFQGTRWFGYRQMLDQIRLSASTPTSLVVGDFNLTERNAVYREICKTGLVDSYRERRSDPGFTFPAFGRYRHIPLPPLLRIDYIWHTPDLRCVSIERTNSGDSDHLGLIARITRK